MKKLYVYTLAALLALSLTACGKEKQTAAMEATEAGVAEETADAGKLEATEESAAIRETAAIEESSATEEAVVTEETAALEETAPAESETAQAPPRWVLVPELISGALYAEADGEAVPINLEQLTEKENHVSMPIEWMKDNQLFLPFLSGTVDADMAACSQELYMAPEIDYERWAGYARSFYDENYIYAVSDGRIEIFEKDTAQPLYIVSFVQELGEHYGVWAKLEDKVLYINRYYNGYASKDTNYIMAIDMQTGNILWRSKDQTADARNFIVKEDVIVCAYGFTAEEDYIYQLDKKTGRIVSETKLAFMADFLIEQDDKLYVHTYNRDYEFTMK